MSKCILLTWLLVCSVIAGGFVRGEALAQETADQPGDFDFAIERAETRETIDLASFPDPLVPVGGEYLIVWMTVTNTGPTAADYDYCAPDVSCFNPSWFEVVDENGAAFPVDEIVRAAFEQSEEEVHRFGGEIQPGDTARIVLVFDVAPGVAAWVLRGTDEALVPISLPIVTSEPVFIAEEDPLYAELNQTVPVGGIDLAATRAEVRATIDLASFPEPFVPEGEYIVVYLTLTNTGAAAEYDICPPHGRLCLSPLWFELADTAGNAYPVEPIAWSAFSMNPDFLPFGSELAPGFPEPIALVFDVPAGVDEWWLISTPEAPRQFFIRLELDAAPSSIQVVRSSNGGEGAAAGGAVELILDTSGSMLESLEGRRRIDIAKEVLGSLVAETIPPGTPLALRVFGATPDSCETTLAAPLQPLDPAAMASLIAGVEAIDGVNTPIGASLEQVASDLQGAAGTKIVVFVTDGEETCGGDPAAALRALANQGIDVRVNIVGFAVEDEALKAQFREWTRLGNGQYFDAAGSTGLGQAVVAAVQPPFRILDAAGNEAGGGLIDGDPVEVPPGAYDIEVLSATPDTIANVVVESGARVEVAWDDR
ncbi:MAG: VWA domain-containing protein [Chloroflexota bacterium]|nr:VWA domain-containing protein [Chloroflexota bacterium]